MTLTPTTDAGALNSAERSRLERLERTVDRAIDAVGKIAGEALATIRDERLYRLTHNSFEGYVLDRWGFSRATAYRMIDAATAHAHIGPAEDETAGQPVSPRDSPTTAPGRPASPFVIPEPVPEPPEAAAEGRPNAHVWALVTVAEPEVAGRIVAYADDPAELPPPGQRVLIAWVR